MFYLIIKLIDVAIEAIGKLASLFILAIILIMTYEMVMRGVFGTSISWTRDLSTWLLIGFIFLGGPWALAKGKFVRVDVVFERLSPLGKVIIDTTISTFLFLILAGVLVKVGGDLALRSFNIGERSATGGWDGPVWIAKSLVPLGTILLSLAWVSHIANSWKKAFNKELENNV